MVREKTDAEKLLGLAYNFSTPFLELLLERNGIEELKGGRKTKDYIVNTPWNDQINVGCWLKEEDFKNENFSNYYQILFEGLENPKDEYNKKKLLVLSLKARFEADMLNSNFVITPFGNIASFEYFSKVKVEFSKKLTNKGVQGFILDSGFPVNDNTYLVINPRDIGDLVLYKDPDFNSSINILRLHLNLFSIGVVLTCNVDPGKGFLVNLDAVKIKGNDIGYDEGEGKDTTLHGRLLYLVDSGQLIELLLPSGEEEEEEGSL